MKSEPHKPVFFFDRTHGNLIRELLTGVGLHLMAHRNMGWPGTKPDIDWIAECGKYDWAIVSGDKSIERVPEERQAVINGKCKVFMFDDSHETRTEDWAASLLVGRERIVEIAMRANGPFFVTLKPCRRRTHISEPRFIEAAGGGWKPVEQAGTEKPARAPEQAQRTRRSQQGTLALTAPTETGETPKQDDEDDIIIDIETRRRRRPNS